MDHFSHFFKEYLCAETKEIIKVLCEQTRELKHDFLDYA